MNDFKHSAPLKEWVDCYIVVYNHQIFYGNLNDQKTDKGPSVKYIKNIN